MSFDRNIYNRDPRPELTAEFVKSIREFLEYRALHGGILLPDAAMVDAAFNDAMIETGLRRATNEDR